MGSDALRTTPADSASTPCAGPGGYGLRHEAHAAVARFAEDIAEILATETAADVPGQVRAALGPLLATPDLLAAAHRRPGEATYRRHVLYADPGHRFTVLALVWQPGQGTSIHGHSAWGAVGVYEGQPNVCCYDCEHDENDGLVPALRSDDRFGPGATCAVQPGFDDVHRIYNGTDEPVITIHAYGRDLVEDPESINLVIPA
jgi:predicted metal-dependent enzyme (double-stranded beta helix superfamily)